MAQRVKQRAGESGKFALPPGGGLKPVSPSTAPVGSRAAQMGDRLRHGTGVAAACAHRGEIAPTCAGCFKVSGTPTIATVPAVAATRNRGDDWSSPSTLIGPLAIRHDAATSTVHGARQ